MLEHFVNERSKSSRESAMVEKLVLWSFQSDGQELYALSTGRIPPAEMHLLQHWLRLKDPIEATEEGVRKITHEPARDILENIGRLDYHTLETKVLRSEWIRPSQ